MGTVTIVKTGVANTAAVVVGFKRAGAETLLTNDPKDIASAKRVVIPGVGAFAAGIEELEKCNLIDLLKERIENDLPTMGVCLGMHLLCNESEESRGVKGLCVVNAKVKKFDVDVKVPQIGWNKITAASDAKYLSSGYAYFANSFCLKEEPSDWSLATAVHGQKFVAAMERGNILACQFHPELSGEFGQGILKRWLKC